MGGVAAAEDGRGGRSEAIGGEDGGLELGKGFLTLEFGGCVAGDCDVDYRAGGYGGGEKNGGKFDLRELSVRGVKGVLGGGLMERPLEGLTRRLSSVRRTATPASTLPTVREMSILVGMRRDAVVSGSRI